MIKSIFSAQRDIMTLQKGGPGSGRYPAGSGRKEEIAERKDLARSPVKRTPEQNARLKELEDKHGMKYPDRVTAPDKTSPDDWGSKHPKEPASKIKDKVLTRLADKYEDLREKMEEIRYTKEGDNNPKFKEQRIPIDRKMKSIKESFNRLGGKKMSEHWTTEYMYSR